ncbi:ferredoxin reductase family protein [Cumulibacter manganitolerans]|uniref:ferredoxin reductase family protein n=1 Tax=Cumulibacter manganitolerans TaxID=1884992 RepID=UPI001297523B|nr:ferredoxin reductase family protein [Cumulibacter manganitolerans]
MTSAPPAPARIRTPRGTLIRPERSRPAYRVPTDAPDARGAGRGGPPRIRRTSALWRDATALAAGTIMLFVTALWVLNGGLGQLATVGALTSVGRLTGLLASALLLIQVFLMARVPIIERAWGQDKLARVHRWVGFSSFTLMVAHIVLIMLGYAAQYAAGVWATFIDFTFNYAGGLLAVAGTVAICLVVVTSARVARRRLRYESWHLLHLYAYVGVGLVLPHQLWTGQDFVGSTLSSVFWWSLYGVCTGSVVGFRVLLPLWRSVRSRARVVDVRQERPGVTTVTVAGPGVHRLKASGGQFFHWRFLTGRGWMRANPFSLSAAPTGNALRLTAAAVGDGSARLADIRPGTRVLLEGPFGRMHAGTRTRDKVLLMGAGVGITPMRALLEALPQRPGDVTIVNRASTADALLMHDEIRALAAQRGAFYEPLVGRRVRGRDSWLPADLRHLDDTEALLRVCPDVAERDVYVCGSGPWMDAVRRAALDAGVPSVHLHIERFEY